MPEATLFRDHQLPMEGFARLGIDQKAFQQLPPPFAESLLKGEITPMVEAHVKTSTGKEVTLPLRLQLLEGQNEREARLVVYPVRKELENTLGLSPYELERVRQGEVITKDVITDGRRFPEFVQLDPRTNSLVHIRVDRLLIEEELRNIESIKDIQLGSNQKDAIREGRPVELKVGDEKVTVGVDLMEPEGFKVVKGDIEQWKRKQEDQYDIDHPEFMGFVKTDRNRWEYQQILDSHRNNDQKQEQVETRRRNDKISL